MLKISEKLRHNFKGFCSSPEIIMLFVYMKCRFSLSYRDLEEIMQIRGALIDHATLQRWVKRFVCLIDRQVRKQTVGYFTNSTVADWDLINFFQIITDISIRHTIRIKI
jgi:transposase-like protein